MGYKAVRLLSETIVVIITIVMAALSFYASYARFFNPQTYLFASIVGLFTLVFVVVNIFLSIYWASKLRAWFFVSFSTILMLTPYISTMYQFPFKSHPPYNERDLCIVTYNVHSFNYTGSYKTNFKDISFLICEKNPDIICFQEIWFDNFLSLDSISKYLDMPYYSVGENGLGVKDYAIFSKYPILSTEHQKYKNTHNGSMFCDISIKEKIIRVVNCHLQTSNINQKKQEIEDLKQIFAPRIFAKAIQNLFKTITNNSSHRSKQALAINEIVQNTKYPIFVCGDINETPSSFVYSEVKGDLKDGFKEAGKGFGATYKKLFGLIRVDYIFHSSEVECVNYLVEKADYSDHHPVFGFYSFK